MNAAPTAGTTVGRFIVLAPLGRGRNGVVVAAYDPSLDRKVALKLVDGDGARLQREAQAMARLSHPNLVAVHEVGVAGEQLFVAMELVDGETLGAWLRGGTRGWRDIVARFVAAGRGLCAVHAAGLAHGEFDADHVLVGRDGRVRVGDFGAASGDARGDQRAFAAALAEALGRRAGVPRALGEAVARGQAARDEDGWPSLAAMVDALAEDRGGRRRRLGTALAALALLAAIGGGLAWDRHARGAACARAADRLHTVWDAERRRAVEHAFVATGLPYARDTFVKVAAMLDRYTADWTAMSVAACRATRVERRQPDPLLDLRMACLDERRATLRALTDVWAGGVDGQALENAITASTALPPVDECADARALSERVPPPREPAARAAVEAVRRDLDRVRALRDAKRLGEARPAADAARAAADRVGWVPLRAEAALLAGSLARAFEDPNAIAPLADATRLAAAARDDRLAADAAIELTGAMLDGSAPAALGFSDAAEALVARAGDRAEQRGRLLLARGRAAERSGRYGEARAALTEARTLLLRALGPRHPQTLDVLVRLARTADAGGDYAAARALSQELVEVGFEALGPDHPETGELLHNLGLFAYHAGDYDRARALYQRSLAIIARIFGPRSQRAAILINNLATLAEAEGDLAEADRLYAQVLDIRGQLGPEDPRLAHALANMAGLRRRQGRLVEAQALVERALGIMTRTYGPEHPDVAYETGVLADVLGDRGDVAGAQGAYERALATWNRIKGPESLDTLSQIAVYATFFQRHGRCVEARRVALPTLPTLERIGGPHYPALADLLAAVARCELDAGEAAAAVPRLERALEIEERPGMAPGERGAVRFDLARAMAAAGDRGPQPRALAERAERELAQASGAQPAHDLPRVRAWLRRAAPVVSQTP